MCTINKSGFPSGGITLFVPPKQGETLSLSGYSWASDEF